MNGFDVMGILLGSVMFVFFIENISDFLSYRVESRRCGPYLKREYVAISKKHMWNAVLYLLLAIAVFVAVFV